MRKGVAFGTDMPSSLRYFCCACSGKDARADYTFYPKAPKRKRNKSKRTSGSLTFTRKSLLDNEQTEHQSNGAHYKQMVFHTQAKNLSREVSFESHENHNSAAKLVSGKNKIKRRKVQEIFPSETFANNVSRTTFPWMDESFSPTSSSGSNIRLGISSVQMHAQRSLSSGSESFQPETAITCDTGEQNNTDDDKLEDATRKHYGFNINCKSRSADHYDEEPRDKYKEIGKSLSMKEERKSQSKYKTPKSDIGVRQIIRTKSRSKEDRNIPKLEDLKCLPATDVSHLAIPQRRPQSGVQNVFNDIEATANRPDSKSDVSFTSSVSFQTNRSGVSERSHKSKQPLTVVPRPVSKINSRPIGPRQSHQKYTQNLETRESMYGYIPKIVQTVQASNALEGSRIDDFFIQCLNENELNSFASAQEIKTPRSQSEPNSTVIRTSSVPVQEKHDRSVVKHTKSDNNIDVRNGFEIQQVSLEFGSQDSLDTYSFFFESNSLKQKHLAENSIEKLEKVDEGKMQYGDTFKHLTKDEETIEIPFIDQEPDLIQGLKNVNVTEKMKEPDIHNEYSKSETNQPAIEIPWEHTFSSQSEYIQSIPLKVPCPPTPPLSWRGDGLSVHNRKSHKSQGQNAFWMNNVDLEVLY